MRQMFLLATWTLIGAALIAFGIYLVVPGRNLYGDPAAELEIANCVLPDDTRLRLYQGDSAAIATWYSVTHDPWGPQRERQIVYRRSPGLYDLVCDPSGVVIRSDVAPIVLTAEQAQRLREQPVAAPGAGAAPGPSAARWVLGALLVIAGAVLLWFLRPRPGDGAEDASDD
jgi:hypothetical protein